MKTQDKQTGDVATERLGRSWCHRAPVIQVGNHLECSECGAAQACDTYGRTARPVKKDALANEASYLQSILKEAA